MPERFDERVRVMVAELIDAAPEAPPLPVVAPRQIGWVRWTAAGATAMLALVVGLALFLPDGGDEAALPDTTVTTEATDAADTTMPTPEHVAAIAALDDACTRLVDSGDLEGFREDVAAIPPPSGEATFFSGIDVQIARAIALEARGDDAGVAEQLERIAVLLAGFGAGGCDMLGG